MQPKNTTFNVPNSDMLVYDQAATILLIAFLIIYSAGECSIYFHYQ